MQLPKPANTTRIITKNVNSLRIDDLEDDITELCGDQHNTESDIYGICEHNRDTKQYNVRQKFVRSAKLVLGQQHLIELGSSDFLTISSYKPGGTGLIAQGAITGRIQQQGSDKYGRWSFYTMRGSDDTYVTIFQIYQVSKNTTRRPGITAYQQQEIAFRSENRKDVRPRHNFCNNLICSIRKTYHGNHSVIIMGDFNEHVTDQRSTLQRLALDCNLVDVWATLHPNKVEPATYLYGRKRIDYILVSAPLVPAVTAIGYEPFHEYLPTDHRGVFVDFDTRALFGLDHTPLTTAPLRSLQSKHAKCRATHIAAAAAHAHENNLFQRLTNLTQSNRRDDELIEQLDKLLGECCQLGERRCTKIRTTWYTKEIDKLRKWRRILQKLLSHYAPNHLDIYSQLETQRNSYNITDPLPTTRSDTRKLLTNTRQQLRRAIATSREKRLQEQLQQIETEAANQNSDKAKIITQIKNAEQKNATWGMFRKIRGKNTKTALTTVAVPTSWPTQDKSPTSQQWHDPKIWAKDSKPFRTISLPPQIEYYLPARNRAHFGKAAGTPFTVPPLSTSIKWTADTPEAEMILEGKYDASSLDDITQMLLQFCKQVSIPDAVSNVITLQEFEGKLRAWREATSTSPSG